MRITTTRILLLTLSMVYGATFAQEQTAPLTASYKAQISHQIIALLKSEYVLPDKAQIAADEIQRRLDVGDYDEISDLQTFANRLTGTLDIIDDWHLGVNFYPEPIPEGYDFRDLSQEQLEEISAHYQRHNYGFEKIERLPGNIGYIEFRDFFYEAPYSETTLASAMQVVEHTDGLIIDLRRNGGGMPDMVQLFISYLVAEKVLIWTNEYRKGNRIDEVWTLDSVTGPRYAMSKPVYLLTSHRTFSAAEAFTYALQSLDRVTVFGEVTIGGAHPTDNIRLDDHLIIRLPVAQSLDPRTGGNWQYVGIQPDHELDAQQALDAPRPPSPSGPPRITSKPWRWPPGRPLATGRSPRPTSRSSTSTADASSRCRS